MILIAIPEIAWIRKGKEIVDIWLPPDGYLLKPMVKEIPDKVTDTQLQAILKIKKIKRRKTE